MQANEDLNSFKQAIEHKESENPIELVETEAKPIAAESFVLEADADEKAKMLEQVEKVMAMVESKDEDEYVDQVS